MRFDMQPLTVGWHQVLERITETWISRSIASAQER